MGPGPAVLCKGAGALLAAAAVAPAALLIDGPAAVRGDAVRPLAGACGSPSRLLGSGSAWSSFRSVASTLTRAGSLCASWPVELREAGRGELAVLGAATAAGGVRNGFPTFLGPGVPRSGKSVLRPGTSENLCGAETEAEEEGAGELLELDVPVAALVLEGRLGPGVAGTAGRALATALAGDSMALLGLSRDLAAAGAVEGLAVAGPGARLACAPLPEALPVPCSILTTEAGAALEGSS